jgi:glucose-1-phosphate adenylyltransferase
MIASHRNREADITVGVVEVLPSEISRFGIVTLDHTDKIVAFEEKPAEARSNLASMGIYVFNKDMLIRVLEETHRRGGHDFGRDILPFVLNDYKVYGYRYRGYWRDIGTIQSYWQANIDLLADLPQLNLYDPDAEVRTVFDNLPPAKLGPRASISRSLISHGCIIDGTISNSVLSPGVCVEEGAQVIDSIVFDYSTICKGAIVHRCIIDKECWIGPGCLVGHGDDNSPNKDEPENLNTSITVIGKGAKLPSKLKVGRNCRIGCWVERSDFSSDVLPSGSSVERRKRIDITSKSK